MTRGKAIRALYAELRRALGDTHAAADLLVLARRLLDLHECEDGEDGYAFGASGGIAFAALPLDAAMADGGWRVLRREAGMLEALYDDEQSRHAFTRRRVPVMAEAPW